MRLFISVISLLLSTTISAQSFVENGMNFKPKYTVAFAEGSYRGDVVVPKTVEHDGIVYFVTEIDDYAFRTSPEVTSIEVGNYVEKIGMYAIGSAKIKSINLPINVRSLGTGALMGSTIESITVDEGNQYFSSVDGVLYDKYQKTLVQYPEGKKAESIIVPEGVVKISNAALFSTGASIVDLPSTLESLGSWQFDDCSNLKVVIVRATTPPYANNCLTHGAILYVPRESVEGYRNAEFWSEFADIRSIDDELSVEALVAERKSSSNIMYNLQGVQIKNPSEIFIQDGKKYISK